MQLPDIARMFGDGLQNVVSGLGTSRDKSTAGRFGLRVLDWAELDAMYRDDWVGRKIVDLPAKDATKKWREWKGDQQSINRVEALSDRLRIPEKTNKAMCWSRLDGGAAFYLDDGGSPEQEISPQRFRQNSLRNVHVLSRRRLTLPEAFNRDISSRRYTEPEYFRMVSYGRGTTIVHASRIIPFHGATTPDTDDIHDFWGDSVLRAAYDAVQNAARAPAAVAALLEEAKVDIVEIENLTAQLSTTQSSELLTKRWGLGNLQKSINNMLMLDKGREEYKTRQISFSDQDKVMMIFLLIVCGAADIPAPRMLGQSAVGLSATGEGDLRNYYDSIEAMQKSALRSAFAALDPFLMASALGDVDDTLSYTFPKLMTPTDKEASEINKQDVEAIVAIGGAQLANREAFAEAVDDKLAEGALLPTYRAALERARQREQDLDTVLPGGDDDPDDPEAGGVADAAPRPLYVHRKVLNADEVISWARGQGIENLMPAEELQVTVAFSRNPVDWFAFHSSYFDKVEIVGGPRLVEHLGPNRTLVLLIQNDHLTYRHKEFLEGGASWDWPEFQPHISLVAEGGEIDAQAIESFQGDIVLGPEVFEALDL